MKIWRTDIFGSECGHYGVSNKDTSFYVEESLNRKELYAGGLNTSMKNRKQGSASELIYEFQDWLIKEGKSVVFLAQHGRLIPFYQKRGCQLIFCLDELPKFSRSKLWESRINFSFNLQEE